MIIQYFQDFFLDKTLFAELRALMTYVHGFVQEISIHDITLVIGSLVVFVMVLYLFSVIYKKASSLQYKLLFILTTGIIEFSAWVFKEHLKFGYASYLFRLSAPYFLIYALGNWIFAAYAKDDTSKHLNSVVKILKFDFYSLLNWCAFNAFLWYFIPNDELIQKGFIRFFVFGIFIIFVISVFLLRKFILEVIEKQQGSVLKKIFKMVYSGTWLVTILFLLMWLFDDAFLIKCEKFIISISIFVAFYLFKWWFKKLLAKRARTSKLYEKELWQLYRFINFLFKLLLDVVIAFVVFYAWGVDITQLALGIVEVRLARKLCYLFVLFVVFRVWFIFSSAVSKNLLQNLVSTKSSQAKNVKRVRTLTSIINITLKTVLATLFFFFVLVVIGINPTPVFANFWVLTAGLSFSLQTIMKDIVVGVLMMFEETVQIGDEVSVGDVSGQVEEITLRALKIRNNEGALVFVPFSKVEVISNKSCVYNFIVLPIVVNVTTDVCKVKVLMEEASRELRQNPDFAHKILEDIRIAGPISLSHEGLVYEGKIKVVPMSPKMIKSEYYRICKRLFDENGITFPNGYLRICL